MSGESNRKGDCRSVGMQTRSSRCHAFVLALATTALLFSAVAIPKQDLDKAILAVFAHPDDDVAIGPLLAHYAARGTRVYLAIVTSGDRGVTQHAKIPAGEQLAEVREAEAKAACRAYGILEPLFLREKDGTISSMQHHDRIVKSLKDIMQKTRPTVIITWGAEGLTGHPDHRAVGNLVTEVFQMWDISSEPGYVPAKLYYVAYPQSKFLKVVPPFPGPIGSVRDSYITTIIAAKDGLAPAAHAMECYRSQQTPDVMKAFNEMMSGVLQGNVPLRLAFPRLSSRANRETDLFDKD